MKQTKLTARANLLGFAMALLLLYMWLASLLYALLPEGANALGALCNAGLSGLGMWLCRRVLLWGGVAPGRKSPFLPARKEDILTLRLTLLALGLFLVSNILGSLLAQLLRILGLSAAANTYNGNIPFALGLVAMALLPAFFEELLFRGTVLPMFAPWGGAFAATLSAFAFALFHWDITTAVPAFLMGWFFAYTAQVTGSLALPFLFHLGYNALSLLLIWARGALFASSALVLTALVFGVCLCGLIGSFFLAKAAPLPALPAPERPDDAPAAPAQSRLRQLVCAPAFLLLVAALLTMTGLRLLPR